ncbi:hypothetical protein D210916BOD24_28260 [Alteromonas sp. D210916BOD_24]|uniref:ATP-grasp domain-containing protein n=1 Tax=Alteromonas sp. D210916BOD_24 TaxID=3157618 RepID=UPI00399C775E
MHIALIGSEVDPQIIHIANALRASHASFFIANTEYFGTGWSISYDPDFNDGLIHFDHAEIGNDMGDLPRVTFSAIHACYWHEYRAGAVENSASDDSSKTSEYQWTEQERSSTLLCWFSYEDIKWVNPIEAIRSYQCKPVQLKIAGKLGANIPYSFVGNATEVAAQFCSNMREIIYKPTRGGQTAQFVNKQLNMRPLLQALLQQRPVMFQKYIAGTHIRSFVLGDEVVSVRIESNELDYRNDKRAQITATVIPKDVQQLAIELCKALGMHWCAIDWRKSAKNTFFFLEANPSPFFLTIEKDTGQDITGRLITLLTS